MIRQEKKESEKNRIMTLELQRKVIFGTELKGIENMILTPINAIFKELSARTTSAYKGWWKTAYYSSNTAIVKAPIGRHIEDAIYFGPMMKKIIFAGYCGACKADLDIGMIVSAHTSIRDGTEARANITFSKASPKKAYQVATFHEEKHAGFMRRMLNNDIDIIDMESHSVLSHAKRRAEKYGCLFIISDNINLKPFYSLGEADFSSMKESISRMTEIVLESVAEQ